MMNVDKELNNLIEKYGIALRLNYEAIGDGSKWSLHTWSKHERSEKRYMSPTLAYGPSIPDVIMQIKARLEAEAAQKPLGPRG